MRGQSFLYNQIRMMVGAAWAVSMGFATQETLTQVLETPVRFAPQLARGLFPMAPAEGLVLMDSGFDRFPKMSIATDDRY